MLSPVPGFASPRTSTPAKAPACQVGGLECWNPSQVEPGVSPVNAPSPRTDSPAKDLFVSGHEITWHTVQVADTEKELRTLPTDSRVLVEGNITAVDYQLSRQVWCFKSL